ncbi:MAG TPA: SPFH domain-containing protein [Thermoguttaceae bacterium]|nr:SPFH domain-containing protein [Thermoguttaceae bacterium]
MNTMHPALLGAISDLTTGQWLALIFVLAAMGFATFLMFVARFYKRCASNEILVIYGKTRNTGHAARCIHGGATFVVPLFQDYAKLGLEPMQIAIPLRDALSIENIRVNVPSVFTVAIGTTPELMQNAAIRLLGLSVQEIEKQAADIIFGQLRQVIASMKIEDINRDRDKFLINIQDSLEVELRKIGLVLINVNITDITDESGYIEAIGRKAASEAIQKARGDVADNEKMGAIRVADAQREQDVQVASATKLREIGTREALREQAVRVAELDKEQQVGEQTAAFQRQAQVKQAERDMRIELADADARAIEGENTAKAAVASSMAELHVKEATAYQLGETKKVEAQAAVIEAGHLAQAKAALAEAKRVEAKQRAELEAPAIAQKARTIVEAEAEAERRRIEAQGQASAIFAQLEAEARGQYEILAKKGQGLREIINACGGSQEAFQLLMLEHFDNLVDASAKAIANIKFDKVVVWEGGGNGKSATSDWLQNMARTLPPMLQVMKDIGGIEIPETLARFHSVKPNGDHKENAKTAAEPVASPAAHNKPADPDDDGYNLDVPDADSLMDGEKP